MLPFIIPLWLGAKVSGFNFIIQIGSHLRGMKPGGERKGAWRRAEWGVGYVFMCFAHFISY
jgi:hypothetical protein